MNTSIQRSFVVVTFVAGPLSATGRQTGAQWLNYPTPGVPRTPDGRVDLTAAPPRQQDGHIDFSGVWLPDPVKTDATLRAQTATLGEATTIRLKTSDGMPIPFLPTAQAAFNERRARNEQAPSNRCLPHTVVDAFLVPEPFKFVHSRGLTVLLFEEGNQFRQVFTDGRPFPTEMQPAWFGYSIGHWEADTFVVDTRGFNDRGRLDVVTPLGQSETLHTTERFRRPSVGTLQVRITIDDPVRFSHAWTAQTIWFRLLPDTEFIEYICENEKDAAHLAGK